MTTIKFRRDTSANWTSVNPIPAQGEPCYETDTGKLKIGNGSDNYVALPYVSGGGGSSGDLPIATATTLGGIKVGNNLSITEDGTLSANGGSGGTTDYTKLENKPQINSIELTGNKTLDDLGIQAKGNYLTVLPDNAVTTDTAQTISGSKTFSAQSNFDNGCKFNSSTYSANYFKKGFRIGNVDIYNTTGNIIRMGGSSTKFLTFNDNNIKFMSSSSTPGMNITDGVVTTAYNEPYLKIKEYNDNTDTHNLEISCDTTNNNNWNIACGDQTFINTANIDTTYMKWDSSTGKLKVDTAAVAGLAMPSDRYVDLTLGATGSDYTAPANGWVFFQDTGNQSSSALVLRTNFIRVSLTPGEIGNPIMSEILPVQKGEIFYAEYAYVTGENRVFRFIYAQGSK